MAMFEVESPTWIAVVIAGIVLLQNATKDMKLCRWLSPLHLGWIISGLYFIHPHVLKGSWIAMGAGYLLFGALIVNTLILGLLSMAPSKVISFKSQGLETMWIFFIGVLCTGMFVAAKTCVSSIGTLLSKVIKPKSRELSLWTNA